LELPSPPELSCASKISRDISFASRLPDLLVAAYLIAQGTYSIIPGIREANLLNGKLPSLILLLLPAVTSFSISKIERKNRTRFGFLWISIGIVIAVFCRFSQFHLEFFRLIHPRRNAFCHAIFGCCYVLLQGIHRFLLGLAAVTWIINISGLPRMAELGIGIFMGAIVLLLWSRPDRASS